MLAPVTGLERLRETGIDQHGLVTTAQALVAGDPHRPLADGNPSVHPG
ncbi:MAG: hypothetical protein LBK59_11790 [Bifidobacteriaceae bacterium]|nr:hypothetical protein [Bifidobacteriaceae bacterium]